MALTPVRRAAVSDQVFVQLRDAILAGEYAPGDALPAERLLAEQGEVNRHAVREAIRRLQQSRLVEVSHGGATRVLDWREHAGLDLVVQLAEVDESDGVDALPVGHLVRDTFEMRAAIGADAARLCARRADEATRNLIVELAAVYRPDVDDLAGLVELDLRFWREIVLGSDNVGYLLALNSLVGGALRIAKSPHEHRESELLDAEAHRVLADHISCGRAAEAGECATELLSRSIPVEGAV